MDLAMSLSRGCWSRSKPLITQRHLRPPKVVVVIKCRKIQILSNFESTYSKNIVSIQKLCELSKGAEKH